MADSGCLHEFLQDVECFASLDADALRSLENRMRLVAYDRGDTVCEEGEPGHWMFVVESGELAVLKNAEGESPIQVALLHPGDFGGMMSLFDQEPRSATLVARSPTRLWILSHETFEELLQANHAFAMKMLRFLSQRMRRDSHNLAATLRYTHVSGLDKVYVECSPQERLILDTINHKVAAANSLDEVMNFYFDSMQKVGPCDRVGLAFVEQDGNRVVSYWNRARYAPLAIEKGFGADLRGSSLESMLSSGAPRIINDLEAYAREHPNSQSSRLILSEGIRSSIACPLSVEGRPVGILFRSARLPNAYDEHQVRIHYAVADRLSQAVDKAYRIEQLTAANQGYFEMLGFVTHELRSPLSSMVMTGNTLLGGYLGELEAPHRESLEKMMRQAHYLLGLINDYLNLARMEGGQFEVRVQRDVDFIETVLKPALDLVRPQLEEKRITLECNGADSPVLVECAPELLQIVMVNLLSNAVKYGVEHGMARVDITRERNALHIAVWNEGPGFPANQHARLFRKFSRIQTAELLQRKGTGVGLYTTWRIVQAHHGHIEARSQLGKWAEFSFEIPQPIDQGL